MADVIGPNFSNEIHAAGLGGLPFSWGADGVNLADPRLTDVEKAAIEAVVAAHDPAKPDPRALYAGALAEGCAIVSTATPGLSATYAAAGERWQQMRDEALYIASFGAFSGGLLVLDWPAESGTIEFATIDQFKAVVRAIGDWLTLWQRFIAGATKAPPASPITIA